MASIPLLTEAELQSATITSDGDLIFTRNNGEIITAGNLTGALKAKYLPVRTGREAPLSAFARMSATLAEGKVSTGFTVQGDSTGKTAGKTRWPELVAPWLADQFPAYAVQLINWNNADAYAAPIVLSGTPSDRRCAINQGAGGVNQCSLLHPGFGITLAGDLDIRVKVSFPAWPNPSATQSCIASRTNGAAGGNSWNLYTNTNGTVRFTWSADGSTNVAGGSQSSVLPIVANQPMWVRVTLTVATGVVAYYYSTDGTTWTAAGGFTVGATSVYNASAQPYQMGGYGTNGGRAAATFWGLEVRDGISGPSVVPFYPDAWAVQASVTDVDMALFSGKPVLTVLNGSWPGAQISHFVDDVNFPRLYQYWHNPAAVILSLSHNEGVRTGPAYLAQWDAWLTKMRGRTPYMPFVLSTQNPKVPGLTTNVAAHAIRRGELLWWAQGHAVTAIDVYRAFLESGVALTTLVDSDGIHPSDSSGSPLWAEVVEGAILGRLTPAS
jgi:hypothetical protein